MQAGAKETPDIDNWHDSDEELFDADGEFGILNFDYFLRNHSLFVFSFIAMSYFSHAVVAPFLLCFVVFFTHRQEIKE